MVAFVSACCRIGRAHVCSSHLVISYAVFCLKKKKKEEQRRRDGCNEECDGESWAAETRLRILCGACSCVAGMAVALILLSFSFFFFFFNDTAPPEIYPLSLHDALPI